MVSCDPFATHFDVLVEYAGRESGVVTASVLNSARADGAISDIEYLEIDSALDDGCTLADVVSVSTINGTGGVGTASATATVSMPGSSSVQVTLNTSINGVYGGDSNTTTGTLSDGETIQFGADGLSGGDYQLCAEVVDVTAIPSTSGT